MCDDGLIVITAESPSEDVVEASIAVRREGNSVVDLICRARDRSMGEERVQHEQLETRVDDTPEVGKPRRSSPVVPDVQDASQAERGSATCLRTQQATGPAPVGDCQRQLGPSR